MLGKIIGTNENTVLLKLSIDLNNTTNLTNMYVLMDSNSNRIVGEINDINDGIAYINLVGEVIDNKFVFGVIKKPDFNAVVKLIPKESVKAIISVSNYNEKQDLYLGKSPIYDGVDIYANIDSFFSNHFSIFGSTGSGKSCSVSRLFQNLFSKQNALAYNSNIFIFDAYGEYHSAFTNLNQISPKLNFKAYTTDLTFGDSEILQIPLWLLSVDDIALLLEANNHSQLPIIEKALKYVNVFAREETDVIKVKDDIIARVLLDIMSSGKPSSQIRDQIFSILSHYNTKNLNLDSIVTQPGYNRPLRQCFVIDASGKIREMELITNFFEKFLQDSIELSMPDGSFMYTLNDLKDAFDFALISEGILNSTKIYDDCNVLKVRLNSLVNGEYSNYFKCKEYVTKEQFIKNLLTASNGEKAQIVNFNINYIDDRFAKTITKIYSKLLFDYAKGLDQKASQPFHIVLEEAHRYVQNDNDINLLGYNIFERISKEGRKYGVLLGLISQRPSEISATCLSQCNNFLIFKMIHPKDISYIEEMISNITSSDIKRIKILQPGMCMAFGTAFKVPVIIKFDMPNPAPDSSSCQVSNIWFENNN